MRNCDRQTLAASIAAHLTFRDAADFNTPDFSWGKPDVEAFLLELTRMAQHNRLDDIHAVDKRIHSGGTAFKFAIWSIRVDRRTVHNTIVKYAMAQRPKELTK